MSVAKKNIGRAAAGTPTASSGVSGTNTNEPVGGQLPPDQAPEADAAPQAGVGSPAHDQWLLDEALAETFPASDPISPSPGTGRA